MNYLHEKVTIRSKICHDYNKCIDLLYVGILYAFHNILFHNFAKTAGLMIMKVAPKNSGLISKSDIDYMNLKIYFLVFQQIKK